MTAPTRELLDGARAGDEAAWEQIVTDLGPRIRGYARARGAPDPDDVTQDVLVAAAERIGDFDGDERAFRSWLFSIAYRQIVNRHRVRDKQPVALPATLVDGDRGPEDEAVASAMASDAIAALDVLGDTERDVVLMRVLGDLDTKDVAAAIGKRPGTVRVIQSRAMTKLRTELRRRGYAGVGAWAAILTADLVTPITAANAWAIAAASVAPTVAAAAGTSAIVKTAAAVAITAALGAGAAATGTLPDPMQRWVADATARIGIELPRPADTSPVLDPVDPDSILGRDLPTLDTVPPGVSGGPAVSRVPDASVDIPEMLPLDPPETGTTLPLDPIEDALP